MLMFSPMVTPSIIAALRLIKDARIGTQHSYDSDYMPDWVTEVAHSVEVEISSRHINLEHLPSALEELMFELVTEWAISENISAAIDDDEMREHERLHWYP